MPIVSGPISWSFLLARWTKRRVSTFWTGLSAVAAEPRGERPEEGRDPGRGARDSRERDARAHERGHRERDSEEPTRAGGEDEPLGLGPADDPVSHAG